ncbi:MAG: hypothetical protein AB7Q27_11220, partial [Acidimicrobiia bacterium]
MATRQTSRRAPARKRSRSRRRRQPFLRGVVSGHEADLFGLAIIVLAVVTALGVYLDVAGPLGRGIDTAAGAVLGVGRYLAPALFVLAGVAMVRGFTSERTGKVAVGTMLLALVTLGFLHLAKGPHEWPGRVDDVVQIVVSDRTPSVEAAVRLDGVRDAGGWVGATVAQPLRSSAGPLGAGAILAAIGLLGALLITGSTLLRFGEILGIGVRPVARGTKSVLGQMTSLARERVPTEDMDDTPAFGSRRPMPVLYDGAD